MSCVPIYPIRIIVLFTGIERQHRKIGMTFLCNTRGITNRGEVPEKIEKLESIGSHLYFHAGIYGTSSKDF